jgi:hypothetical protein
MHNSPSPSETLVGNETKHHYRKMLFSITTKNFVFSYTPGVAKASPNIAGAGLRQGLTVGEKIAESEKKDEKPWMSAK